MYETVISNPQDGPYKGGQAASTGSDLELSIQIPDGSGGEEALHQQQDTEQKESGGQSVDDILQEVDAAERERTQKKPTSLDLYGVLLVELFASSVKYRR